MSKHKGAIFLALLLIVGSWFPANAQTVEERLQALETRVAAMERLLALSTVDIPTLVKKASPAVVSLYVTTADDEVISQGTGFLVSKDGLVVTNSHVVDPKNKLKAKTADGKEHDATLLFTDPFLDIAFLTIPGKEYPTLTFAETKPLVGEPLVVIGNAYGYSNSVTVGVVSGVDRPDPYHFWHYPSLQTDAAINHGNSGGPILGRDGKVVAVATWTELKDKTEGIAFGIPADIIRRAMAQFDLSRGIVRPWLGVAMREPYWSRGGLTNELGLYVSSVHPLGAAGRAGMREGDWLVSVNGTPTNYLMDLRAKIETFKPGDTVSLVVARKLGGQWQNIILKAVLGESSATISPLIPTGYNVQTDDLF